MNRLSFVQRCLAACGISAMGLHLRHSDVPEPTPAPPSQDDHGTHVEAHRDALRRFGICPRCYNRDKEVEIGFLECRECWALMIAEWDERFWSV